MKKYILLFFVLLYGTAGAQHNIETRLVYADTTRFNFTSEWQYLSTDVFLFNGEQFSTLINELEFEVIRSKSGEVKYKKKRGSKNDVLSYLFIGAQVSNNRFFGDKNVTYPLYNFRIDKDKYNKYQTFVSDNIERVRLLDHLALSSAGNNIDAQIEVRAIAQNERDNMLAFMGQQLQNLSVLLNPTAAVFSLVGEIGKFIESGTRQKEYKFSSSIRLFEQNKVEMLLHSVRLYAITTANSDSVRLELSPLQAFIDSAVVNDLTRDQLEKLLNYTQYPLILVANYKLRYSMETISGDEVTFGSIDKRKVHIENSYRNGLINEESYKLEKDYISFLTAFANLKSHIELYTTNNRMGNTDAAFNGLTNIVQQYRSLLKQYDEVLFRNRENKLFTNVFRQEYLSIIDYAGLYLEGDHQLKAAKDLVRTMMNMERADMAKLSDTDLEEQVRTLHFADRFEAGYYMKNGDGQLLRRQLDVAEEYLYKKNFADRISKLYKLPAIPANRYMADELSRRVDATHCTPCREQAIVALKDFNTRYEAALRDSAMLHYSAVFRSAETYLLEVLPEIDRIAVNYERLQPSGLDAILLEQRVQTLQRDAANLADFLQRPAANLSTQFVNALTAQIGRLEEAVRDGVDFIKKNRAALLRPAAQENAAPSDTLSVR